jgi:hypothetical protein
VSRRIEKLPDHVYFVIGVFTSFDGREYKTVDGPYSTLGAAKGKRTSMAGANAYRITDEQKAERLSKYTIVESPAGEWKKVDLD